MTSGTGNGPGSDARFFYGCASGIFSGMTVARFRKIVWDHYRKHGRHDMAWRHTRDPYRIVVSEVMLQQTQVARVAEKYPAFIAAFPSFAALAAADQGDVLAAWQGLGYNRRGMYLKRLAEEVIGRHGGVLPRIPEELEKLPGIGPATARSIAAFAFNAPVVFIETNVRSVFIREFFPDAVSVRDSEIVPLAEAAMPRGKSREWYWALMDYGAHIKANNKNPSQRSAHHAKQKPFAGSDREVRGKIVKLLIERSPRTIGELREASSSAGKIRDNLKRLVAEGMIRKKGGAFAA